MLTTRDILWGVVYPLVVALVAIIISHIPRRGRRDTHPWGVPLALVAGFTIAFIGISGMLNIPPRQGQEWLVIAAAAAFIVSVSTSLSNRMRWPLALLSIALLLATAWLI